MIYRLLSNTEGHSLATVLMHTDVWGIEMTSAVLNDGTYTLTFASALPEDELEHIGLTVV